MKLSVGRAILKCAQFTATSANGLDGVAATNHAMEVRGIRTDHAITLLPGSVVDHVIIQKVTE